MFWFSVELPVTTQVLLKVATPLISSLKIQKGMLKQCIHIAVVIM